MYNRPFPLLVWCVVVPPGRWWCRQTVSGLCSVAAVENK